MHESKRAEVFTLLRKELRWAGEKSAFYKERFSSAGIEAKKINSWEDFTRVPCLGLTELEQADAFRLLTLPLSGVLRAVRSGGEADVLKLFTRGDVMQNVEMLVEALTACGLGRGGLVGVMGDMSEGFFLDVQYALECMGITSVPMGQEPSRARGLMADFAMDALITTPKLFAKFISGFTEAGMDLKDQPLRRVLLLSNALPVPQIEELEKKAGVKIYSLYVPEALGTAGLLLPGTDGSYMVAEKFFYTEILDFSEGAPRAAKCGEVVVTALRAEAMPVIRLRTGLSARLLEESSLPYGYTRLEILG